MSDAYKTHQDRMKKLKRLRARPELQYMWMKGASVPGGHNLIYDGEHKPFLPRMIECNAIPLRHSDVVVDIGAYCGTYSIRCARYPVQRVTAYEPTPFTFDVMNLTQLPNLTNVQAAVVGDERKTVDLYLSNGIGVTNGIVISGQKIGMVTVPAVNYVDAVKGASVVKIDVEGAEYDYPIIQDSIRALIIDFHAAGHDWKDKARSVMQQIKAAGFETVIAPDFSNGWTQAGCWVRPLETEGEYAPMMHGEICCGCGTPIAGHTKSICPDCAAIWSTVYKKGYEVAPCLNF